MPFAGSAFALCPLTLDYDAFRESLNSLNTDLIPRQGTDLASAIREADRLFDAEGNNQRFLVLITDGEDLEGEALKAAKDAAEQGTTIYTVGVGAADGQLIPVRNANGRQSFLRDENGQEVRTKLDSATLQKIAEETGGLYVPLGRGAEGLDAIYKKRLALAPKSELAQKLEKVPLERFQWPLGFAILLLAIQMVMGERKLERKRKELVSAARRVRPETAVLLLAFFLTLNARGDTVANYNSGTSAYGKGEFEQAAKELKSSLETSDLSLQTKAYYNLGNSLYRIGQGTADEKPEKTMETWEQSIKAYDDALALDEQDEDAKYNRDFVQRKLDELKKQQEQENEQNQDQQDQEQQNQDQQNQDQQNQDQQNQDQQNQDQQNQDQQNQDQQNQDQQNQDQQNQDQQNQDQQSGDQQQKDSQQGEGEEQQEPQDGEADEQKEQDSQNGEQKDDPQQDGKPEDAKSGDEGESDEEKEADEAKKNEGLKGQEEKQPQEDGQQPQPAGNAGQEAQEGEPQGNPAGGAAAGEAGEERKEGEMSHEEAVRLLETLSGDERVVIPVPLSEQNRPRKTNKKTW